MIEDRGKEVVWAVIVLVIVGFLALFFSGFFAGRENLDVPSDELRIVDERPERNLEAFPEGFPVEEGIEFSESFKYVPANSMDQQSTLAYLSSKSLGENARLFEEFFSAQGFEIMNEVEDGKMHFYYTRKGSSDLPITLENKSGRVLVTASYLERRR